MLDMAVLASEIAVIVAEEVERATAPIMAENESLRAEVSRLAALIAAMPAAKDGTCVTIEDVQPLIAAQVKEAVAAIPMPKDGTSVAVEDVQPLIAAQVKEAVAALPPAKDGTSVTIDDVQPIIAAQVKDAFAAIPVPKDGADVADMLIDRDGNLVATLTDGRMKNLGAVVGKDGIPFGVDDLDMTLMEDGRTVRMSFTKGDTEYAFQIPFPVVLDRGVFAEGKSYEEGDGVTWGGSFWIAQRATGAKPDGPDSGWRLSVKRGRDGKDKG